LENLPAASFPQSQHIKQRKISTPYQGGGWQAGSQASEKSLPMTNARMSLNQLNPDQTNDVLSRGEDREAMMKMQKSMDSIANWKVARRTRL